MVDEEHQGERGRPLSPETLAAQALGRIDEVTRALVSPIHPSTTYERDPDGGYSSGRGYTRPHNPTYDEPEKLLTTHSMMAAEASEMFIRNNSIQATTKSVPERV